MLVETDSPYLAPEPHRGSRCEPSFVFETAKRLADVLGAPFERVAETTTDNCERLFLRRIA
jgi:TatD DNase family protein